MSSPTVSNPTCQPLSPLAVCSVTNIEFVAALTLVMCEKFFGSPEDFQLLQPVRVLWRHMRPDVTVAH